MRRRTGIDGRRSRRGSSVKFLGVGTVGQYASKVSILPGLKPGQVRCPVCRSGASVNKSGYLRKHRDPFGHECYNTKPPAASDE